MALSHWGGAAPSPSSPHVLDHARHGLVMCGLLVRVGPPHHVVLRLLVAPCPHASSHARSCCSVRFNIRPRPDQPGPCRPWAAPRPSRVPLAPAAAPLDHPLPCARFGISILKADRFQGVRSTAHEKMPLMVRVIVRIVLTDRSPLDSPLALDSAVQLPRLDRPGLRPGHASPMKKALCGPESEAGDRARTGDIQLGRLTLYQLSYTRKTVGHRSTSHSAAPTRRIVDVHVALGERDDDWLTPHCHRSLPRDFRSVTRPKDHHRGCRLRV